jgi:hypothetical protein
MAFKKRHPLTYILAIFLLFPGINGLAGGALLMAKSDGSLLGMEKGWLDHSPFSSYLIPGFLLFSFMGLLPMITLAGLFSSKQPKILQSLNIYNDKHWAWTFSIYTGIIAITWITIQLLMTQYFWIQPVIIFNGLAILVLTLYPAMIDQYTKLPNI